VTRVLVDTSALLALLDRADPRHSQVLASFADLEADDLVTHGYVVAEAIAVARRRFGVDGAIALIDDLLPTIDVTVVDPMTHALAMERYRTSLPSGISFVDQVSFAVMRRDAIETAFAVDADFAGSGFSVLPSNDAS
jgi:predicted nucleic acid-binding protein